MLCTRKCCLSICESIKTITFCFLRRSLKEMYWRISIKTVYTLIPASNVFLHTMKTLVLFTLVSVALAAPAQQEDATEYHQNLQFPAHRSSEYLKRERKSPTEVKSSSVLHSNVPNPLIHADVDIPNPTGRSFALKTPVIVKKKTGYHLYRDSEEEKADADSHETCGRQVKVKLCHEDGKLREMSRSSGHEINDNTSENDMKHSIMMAREAIENLQRDFKRIEYESASGKRDSKSDTDLHEDIEVTRQALEDIHKNFENLETMSLRASALKNSDAMDNLHIRVASTEDERMAQWKAAIENIYKNVEIAQNYEDSFKTADDQDRRMNKEQSDTSSYNADHKIINKHPRLAIREDDMLDMQKDNLKLQSAENTNNIKQGNDETMFEQAREVQETLDDIVSSPSEVIEMKAVEIPNHHSLRSENHKRLEPVKSSRWELKEQEMNSFTSHEVNLNRNAEDTLEEPLSDVQNIVSRSSSTGFSSITNGLKKHEAKMAAIDLNEKTKELQSVPKENYIKNEITEEKSTTAKTTENVKTMVEGPYTEMNEDINEDIESLHHQSENSMRAAVPSNYLNDLHLESKHHNIDYNESEHSAALTEMKTAESNLHHVEPTHLIEETNNENKHLSSMKTAKPSDMPVSDIHVQNKHHNIDYNESEHMATLTEMKTAENNINQEMTALKAVGDVEDSLHHTLSDPSNSQWDHETRTMISLKAANPSDQVPLNDLHLPHKHHNIDYNESEHTAMLTEMKSAENDFNRQSIILKSPEAKKDNLDQAVSEPKNSQWNHELNYMTSLKSAVPSNQAPLNDFHLLHKHHNIDYNESEHTATLTEMKAAENNFNDQGSMLNTLEVVEDNTHQVVSGPLNLQWDHETSPLISLKTADPSDQVPLNDLHLLDKHHNIDYKESEHTATLTEMKEAENNLNHHGSIVNTLQAVEDNSDHVVSNALTSQWDHETRPIISLKTAEPSDQVPLDNINLPHKYHNIDYNESEHTATLTEMKTAEDNLNHRAMVLKAEEASENNINHISDPFNSPMNQNGHHSSMKTIQPLDQVFQHVNIDENESEHMTTLTQMKTSEDHIHPVLSTFDMMETNKHHMLHPKTLMGDSGMSVMKAAQPSQQEALNSVQLNHKHNNVNHDKFEQMVVTTDLKSAEDLFSHHWTASRGMKTVEDQFHHPESLSSNMHWNREIHPMTSLKMANPTNQLAVDHLPLQRKPENIAQIISEHTAKLTDLKTPEGQVHQHSMSTETKHADNDLHHQHSIPPTQWAHESNPLSKTVEDSGKNRQGFNQMRYSNIPDHHFTHNNNNNIVGHGHFEPLEHVHQHSNLPHRYHHNLVRPDVHHMNVHGGVSSHYHSSVRDAMEGLESEHMFRWQPSHESFRSSYASNPFNPINSGGAVGVFPHANTGGCGIPLLLSCSPSVVSGSLAKVGAPYSAPSYSAPSYRMEEDFGFHNKRDTKKTNEIRNNNVLRSSTIVKQKTKDSLDTKM